VSIFHLTLCCPQATFPEEWSNFKERMKSLVPDIDVKELSEIDFAPNAWLYEYRMELQLWASCRGQLLGRTVTGMMRNEKVCHRSMSFQLW
jgi:1,3-beta-glucan synthase